jgi:hypothetical protein
MERQAKLSLQCWQGARMALMTLALEEISSFSHCLMAFWMVKK